VNAGIAENAENDESFMGKPFPAFPAFTALLDGTMPGR
jgi:hypothetical protein